VEGNVTLEASSLYEGQRHTARGKITLVRAQLYKRKSKLAAPRA